MFHKVNFYRHPILAHDLITSSTQFVAQRLILKIVKFSHLPSLIINENYSIKSIFILIEYTTVFQVLSKVISSAVLNHVTKLNP